MPAVLPVATPVVDTIVALALLLLHVPPASVLLNRVVALSQTTAVPVIAAGLALTVTIFTVKQPVGRI